MSAVHALSVMVLTGVGLTLAAGASAVEVTIRADQDTVPMGRTVAVDVVVKTEDGTPAANCRVLSYVNQRRWGAHEVTDADGCARLLLPLPNPGPAEIQVQAIPDAPQASWIWAPETRDEQTVVLWKRFPCSESVRRAVLRIAVDDSCKVFLNDAPLGAFVAWQKEQVLSGFEGALRSGENVLRVEALNSTGPAGLVAELTLDTDAGPRVIATDGSWESSESAEGGQAPVNVLGRVAETLPWLPQMGHWPGMTSALQLMVGRPLPENAVVSNAIMVRVTRRTITVHEDPEHLIGMQWEPWFTPSNAYWQTAEAVPIVGFYDSYNADVLRQHALWLMDAGVNFLFVDWSNHIWGKQHWNERPPSTNEIIHGTTLALEAYAQMRDEGLPVPKFVIMAGLSNGPPATMEALNEEHQWIYENYICNPRFEGLWVLYEDKPLVVPLDCGSVAIKPETGPVDTTHFTVRWMGTQFQNTKMNEHGYWSWMDGCLEPIVTYYQEVAECVTPAPAYFGDGGWLYPQARGRRGGTTYLESFKAALKTKPRFVLLHQWNEFAGQAEGQGYGPKHDIYVDTYNVELSDDLEPVSLTAKGYRGDLGGWGYYYLNLTQALVRVFHQDAPRDTVLAVYPPDRNQVITTGTLEVGWSVLGKEPSGFAVLLDGQPVTAGLQGNVFTLDLSNMADGPHVATVVAEGATTRFPLSYVEMDDVLDTPIPVSMDVPFVLRRGSPAEAQK